MNDLLIKLLSPKTAQLADWQFREAVVEKINEIAIFINERTGESIDDELESRKEKEEEEERIAKEKAEAEELAKQNAGGSQV